MIRSLTAKSLLERHADALAELSELAISAAADLVRATRETKSAKEAAGLAEAFVRLSEEARAAIQEEAELRREIRRRDLARRLVERRRAAAAGLALLPPGPVH